MVNAILVMLTLGILFGVALLFYIIVGITSEESMASAIMTVLLLIYITGLSGNTRIAVYIICVLSVLGILIALASTVMKKEHTIISFVSPSIVMIVIVAALGIVAFHGFVICNWDELYQWGKCADFMMEYDKLPSGPEFTGEVALLSSTTFFHYFMSFISELVLSKVIESNYYVSNLILWFSALILPFSGCKWKDGGRVFAFGLFHFLLASMIFVQPYYNIYTDQATAYWSGCLITWLLLRKYNRKNAFIVPLILINVGFMKSMVGPLFAVIVIVSAVVLWICERKGKAKIKTDQSKDKKKSLICPRNFIILLGVLSPFILVGLWAKMSGGNGLWRFHGLGGAAGEEDRALLTFKAMISWIFKSVTLHSDRIFVSYGVFIVLTIALVNVIHPYIKTEKLLPGFDSLMKIYIVGFVLYFIIMYFTFMTVFEYYASIEATSLNRYFSDYMMLGIVPLTIPLFLEKGTGDKNIVLIKKSIIFVSIALIIYGSSGYFLTNLSHSYAIDTKKYSRREELTNYCDKVKNLTGGEGKIYFINQKRSGLYTLAADYEMGNQLLRGGMCYKFREDTSKKISGMTDYSIDTFPQVLDEQGYEYVWIYSTNAYFTENMKTLFGKKKIKNGYFYKVLHGENGIMLEYLGRIK